MQQATPNAGTHLVPVLSTIAARSGGTFVEWGKGGDDERRKHFVAALAAQLVR